jgi:hypothetical protein
LRLNGWACLLKPFDANGPPSLDGVVDEITGVAVPEPPSPYRAPLFKSGAVVEDEVVKKTRQS